METLRFKTSLKCGGCVANVKPKLDAIKSIYKWEVDLTQPVKILTINGENINEEDVVAALKQSGFTAEKII